MDVYTRLTEQAAVLLGIKRFLLFDLLASVLTNAVLAVWIVMRSDQSRTVILSPGATETYMATDSTVSPNLLERFAVQSLNLILNLTPATAAYQTDLFLKEVAPESYGSLASSLRLAAQDLERNQASTAFYPLSSSVEADARRVCVQGTRKTLIGKAVTSSEIVNACLTLAVRGGRLWIVSLTQGQKRPNETKNETREDLP